jgi:hypothetical protein
MMRFRNDRPSTVVRPILTSLAVLANFWTNESDTIPLFVRAGSILPLGAAVDE